MAAAGKTSARGAVCAGRARAHTATLHLFHRGVGNRWFSWLLANSSVPEERSEAQDDARRNRQQPRAVLAGTRWRCAGRSGYIELKIYRPGKADSEPLAPPSLSFVVWAVEPQADLARQTAFRLLAATATNASPLRRYQPSAERAPGRRSDL